MSKKESITPAEASASTPATERNVALHNATPGRIIPEFNEIQPERGTLPEWGASTDETKLQVLERITDINPVGEIQRVKSELGPVVDIEEAAIRNIYFEGCQKIECDPLETSFSPELKKQLHRMAVLYPAGFFRAVQGVLWSEEAKIDPPEGLYEAEKILDVLADSLDEGTHKGLRDAVAEWDRLTEIKADNFPPELRQRIERIAQENGQSVNTTVRQMLADGVAQHKEDAA